MTPVLGRLRGCETLPLLDNVPDVRRRDLLIAEQFLRQKGRSFDEVRLGDDSAGVPDCWVFSQGRVTCCIELAGYTFGEIEDLRPNKWDGQLLWVDVEASTRTHEPQPPPYTVVKKKLGGERQYRREPDADLVLLIHTEVLVRDGRLAFPMYGVLQMSPSCNYFIHNRDAILEELGQLAVQAAASQWDQVWLADYCYSVDPEYPEYVLLRGAGSCQQGDEADER